MCIRDSITAVFNSENNAVLAGYAVTGLRIYFCGFWFAGCNIVSSIFFSASGRSAQGFLLSMLRGVIAIVPFLFLLTAWFGITGVWVAFPATELFTFLFTAVDVYKRQSPRTGSRPRSLIRSASRLSMYCC